MKRKNGFGWSELIVGVLLILLGIFAFIRPESMLTGAVVIYGVIAIVMGIEDLVVYARLSRFIGFGPMLSLISGILSVMCGVMLIANPNVGKWALRICTLAEISSLRSCAFARISCRFLTSRETTQS